MLLQELFSKRYRGDWLMVTVTLSGAIAWLFSRMAIDAMPPLFFVGARFFIAGVIFALLCSHALRSATWQQWKVSLGTGLLLAAAMLLWVLGLFHSSHLGEAAFIASMSVIAIPFVGFVLYRTGLSLPQLLAMSLSVIGLACLCLDDEARFKAYQLYLLGSAIALALHFVVTSRHIAEVHPLVLAAIQMTTVGVIGLATAYLWAQVSGEKIIFDWGLDIWGALLASCLFGSLLRYGLQGYALSTSHANHAGMILTLEPVWVTLLGAIYLGEIMMPNQWLGCGLILSAIVFYQISNFRSNKHR